METKTDRLAGKSVLVTGAASGIGLAIAQGLVAHGADVVTIDRATSPELSDLALKGLLTPVMADISRSSELEDAVAASPLGTRAIDGLVHCAGVQMAGADDKLANVDPDTWRRTLGVNLDGTFAVCRLVVRRMLADKTPGSLVLCGSPTGIRGGAPDFSAYSVSKGGVHAMTRVLATAYGGAGIRANTLVPGPTETPLTAPIWREGGVREALLERVPMGRLGRPEDYVGAAIFLISDESAFMTGSEVVVDGGFTAT